MRTVKGKPGLSRPGLPGEMLNKYIKSPFYFCIIVYNKLVGFRHSAEASVTAGGAPNRIIIT